MIRVYSLTASCLSMSVLGVKDECCMQCCKFTLTKLGILRILDRTKAFENHLHKSAAVAHVVVTRSRRQVWTYFDTVRCKTLRKNS